ncbi:MAG: DTW domain-containing protein [Bdellovibrionales bacterium]|nr:DTW domain-containing protein [Bdellovibrionales bacterium]
MSSEPRLCRQRKTKEPCPGCFLNPQLCLCAEIPRLDLRTRVSLIIHYRELRRTTNTGRLAVKALSNSSMHVRGQERETLDLSSLLLPEYENLLFFPSDDAIALTSEYVAGLRKPIHLLVPDGNWRQASKVHSRHKELSSLVRVKINEPNTAKYFLRAESSPEGMATLQAIASALRVTEGEEAFRALNALYLLKLGRTLQGRGIQVSPDDLIPTLA